MQLGKFKRQLGVWQFGFMFVWRQPHYMTFSPALRLHFFKLVNFPPDGQSFGKSDYKGFVLSIAPTWTCTFRTFRFGNRYYQIPVKINNFHFNASI